MGHSPQPGHLVGPARHREPYDQGRTQPDEDIAVADRAGHELFAEAIDRTGSQDDFASRRRLAEHDRVDQPDRLAENGHSRKLARD